MEEEVKYFKPGDGAELSSLYSENLRRTKSGLTQYFLGYKVLTAVAVNSVMPCN
jgi:hypothetical protein